MEPFWWKNYGNKKWYHMGVQNKFVVVLVKKINLRHQHIMIRPAWACDPLFHIKKFSLEWINKVILSLLYYSILCRYAETLDFS
jgi:hypothetical protein